MSRRRKQSKRKDVNDDRTSEEKEEDDCGAIEERRHDCDPSTSMKLSSLLFSHKKIYLQPSQIATKGDGTIGFYTYFDHFPDPPSQTSTKETNDNENKEVSTTDSIDMIGFVRARTNFNPVSTCLKNEIRVLKEKIDELDTAFQTIKVELDFNAEEMKETEKAEFTFKMRDLTRELAVERSSVDSLKEKLEIEEDKGIAVVYSTAHTEGKVLTESDVLENYVPPDIDDLEAEEEMITNYRNEEINQMNLQLVSACTCTSSTELKENLLQIVEMKTKIGTREARAMHRKGAQWMESF
jgi:hypothetical protein